MSRDTLCPAVHPTHGQIGYLQLPALDITGSARFYEAVFGWSVDLTYGSFEAPSMIGQWTTERTPSSGHGPVAWIFAEDLFPTLQRIEANGGTVHGPPQFDQGERWLVEVDDPAGNRIGVLQLHDRATGHDHGALGDTTGDPGNGVLLWFGEVADFDDVVERAAALGGPVVLAPRRNPPLVEGNGPSHRKVWITDPDGYTVVVASPDGEAYLPA